MLAIRRRASSSRASPAATGTYNIDCNIDGVTELQPGSFMLWTSTTTASAARRQGFTAFQNSLTVFHRREPSDQLAIVDGGLKAFSTDKPFPPRIKDSSAVTYAFGGDEHGKLTFGAGAKALQVGDKAEFVIPHCDPSVNLYDKLFCLRGDNVEAVWRIAARGMAQ